MELMGVCGAWTFRTHSSAPWSSSTHLWWALSSRKPGSRFKCTRPPASPGLVSSYSSLDMMSRHWLSFSYSSSLRQSSTDLNSGKEPTCQCRRCKRHWFDPWVGKIPWRRKWQPTLDFSLAQKVPWTEHPGRLQSTGSQSRTRLKRLSITFLDVNFQKLISFLERSNLSKNRNSKSMLQTRGVTLMQVSHQN